MFAIGTATGQRVRRSTIVRRWLNPFDVGSVTISRFRCENLLEGTSKVLIGGVTCRLIFACWQGTHSLAHLAASALMEGQTKRSDKVCWVLCTPGCPRPWTASKILRRHPKGTNGRGEPFETSINRSRFPTSTLRKLRPDCGSFEILRKSASRNCSAAIFARLMP